MALVLLPIPALVLGVLWVAVVRFTGAAAAGSVVVAVGLPVADALVGHPAAEVVALAGCGALVVVRHRENLGRLRRGEEAALRPPDRPDRGRRIR
jgi:glycerol-3-phosphate acyltransferase PlsY